MSFYAFNIFRCIVTGSRNVFKKAITITHPRYFLKKSAQSVFQQVLYVVKGYGTLSIMGFTKGASKETLKGRK